MYAANEFAYTLQLFSKEVFLKNQKQIDYNQGNICEKNPVKYLNYSNKSIKVSILPLVKFGSLYPRRSYFW